MAIITVAFQITLDFVQAIAANAQITKCIFYASHKEERAELTAKQWGKDGLKVKVVRTFRDVGTSLPSARRLRPLSRPRGA